MSSVEFDPAIHLAYNPPKAIITMKDLDLQGRGAISSVAVTDPFPLFSQEGIEAMRAEIFDPAVLETFRISSYLSKCQIRGMAPSHAPFINAAWTSPELLKAVSEAAGMELVPIFPYELGHVNVQIDGGADSLTSLRAQPSPPMPGLTLSESESSSDEDETMHDIKAPVVAWHRDGYPWVCVVMLSDVSNMRGGETAIVKGDGGLVKARGPQLGTAVMMQGRYIDHAALQAIGASERVTMVTSFRAKDPLVADDSVLTTIRPISNLEELYYQWSSYRLELLAERFKAKAAELHAAKKCSPGWGHPIMDQAAFKAWAADQIAYFQRTLDEMI